MLPAAVGIGKVSIYLRWSRLSVSQGEVYKDRWVKEACTPWRLCAIKMSTGVKVWASPCPPYTQRRCLREDSLPVYGAVKNACTSRLLK